MDDHNAGNKMHVRSFRINNISENNGLNSNPVCCLAKQVSDNEKWAGQYYTISTMMAKAHSAKLYRELVLEF